jgi:hypothetical protein
MIVDIVNELQRVALADHRGAPLGDALRDLGILDAGFEVGFDARISKIVRDGGSPMDEVGVVDNSAASRYEIRVDGALAGFARYVRHPDRLDFVHTEIDPEFEGRGLGGKLVKGALEDVRANGGRLVASCPFVASYLDRHPEYGDLVMA